MQQILLFPFLHIPLHVSSHKAIFRWTAFELFFVTLLRADSHVGCFVIPNKICCILELDKIQIFMNFKNFMDLETDFVGNDKATYMQLSV
jgi:hypothetical protein